MSGVIETTRRQQGAIEHLTLLYGSVRVYRDPQPGVVRAEDAQGGVRRLYPDGNATVLHRPASPSFRDRDREAT